MNSKPRSTAPASPITSNAANTGFRLGEDRQVSDASDSDQSATSERSLSPSRKRTKSQKRRERKKVGALTDELGELLGAAFSSSNADSSAAVAAASVSGTAEPATEDVEMQTDPILAGKKMNRRTRQNLAKMEIRKRKAPNKRESNPKESVLQAQAAAAERRDMTLDEYQKLRNSNQGKAKIERSARRARKHADRKGRKTEEGGDRMDIG
ncbi:hypothetical protein N0V83_004887 [Neocucurbitaria cava]|uniref:Uncharacterized protein n=1 Tax=Neocucurbitaria cava TaxID=798079 RepID=A0A9W8Y9M7_9PLEO|nr:hypothetical protein N0V83_004887 [Neocucurbitaria cava]